jgi:hypothetical protein
MDREMNRRRFVHIAGMTCLAALVGACRTTRRHEKHEADANESDVSPTDVDQPHSMAADDADAFRAQPNMREPSRRPPQPHRRPMRDQPRIRRP